MIATSVVGPEVRGLGLLTGGSLDGVLLVEQAFGAASRGFRPVGAAHDVLLVEDRSISGASALRHTGIAIVDCAIRLFEGPSAGSVSESSIFGWCTVAMPTGALIGNWTMDWPTDDEPAPDRMWSWWMFHDGALLENEELAPDADPWCVPLAALGSEQGAPIETPDVSGIEDTSLFGLADQVARAMGVGTDEALVLVDSSGSVPGSGSAVFDVAGFEDDSVAGYRMSFTWEATDSGGALTTLTVVPMCRRGTSDDGGCL